MEQQHGIEAWGEAVARVLGKMIAILFRIVWSIIGGFLRGLCLLPFLKGFKKAIVYELNNPPVENE